MQTLHVRVCVFSDGGGAIKSRRAKVAYSYVAESPDELSLEPGQVIKNFTILCRVDVYELCKPVYCHADYCLIH